MDQLSGVDSFILSEERGHNYSHVGTLALYDQSTAPNGRVRFKDILAAIEARVAISPVFRRRLAKVPFGLDRPYWAEDGEVDLEFHVRHIALPQPGDWRQLMIQVARLHSRPLDRSRPLWEMTVIEGLNNIPDLPRGAFAIYTKLHHAAVDGATAIELVRRLHDGEPAPAVRTAAPAALDEASMVKHAIGRSVARAGRTTRFSFDSALKVTGLALDQLAQRLNPDVHEDGRSNPLPQMARAPSTRFSGAVSANRSFEAVGLPFESIRRVRALVPGSTVNDVFLAVSGAALRRYLSSKNELPARSLVALMPISLRQTAPDIHQPGNEVGGIGVALRTDIEDPVEHLSAVQAEAKRAKQQADLVGRGMVMSLVDSLPHFVAGALLRNVMMKQLNAAVSNVRGPEQPVALAGARLLRFYPVSMVTDGAAINHTAISYDGTLWIGIVACRNLLPDPAFYAQCLRDSFDALVARTESVPIAPAARTRRRKIVPTRRAQRERLAA